MLKRKQNKVRKLPVKQGKFKVGYKKPPKETQFKPGQSGNPAGPPKRRIQLWVYFCRYMNMTDAEIKKLDRKKLTQSQQATLKLVEDATKGKYTGSERLAWHVFDREEGKTVEHLVIGNENTLSEQECEEIRELLKRSFEK
jgi:hypothetical protein